MNKTPLLLMLDQIRSELEPLASHYLVDQENIVQNRHLTLLAANMLELGGPSEVQIRLFEMLLVSMKAEFPASLYLQQATSLDSIELKETISFMKTDEGMSNAYLFDLIVLMRINGTLSEQDVQRLSQQFSILSVNELRSRRIVFWALKMMMGETTLDESGMADDIIPSVIVGYDYRIDSVGKFPNVVGCVINSGVISVSQTGSAATVYNQVSFPACLITRVYDGYGDYEIWCVNEGMKSPAIRVIPYLKGLNAWWPMFDSIDVGVKPAI
ncbi:hypothetical protein [Aeromonas enteropelogenes]|uniref:hypothetical protein n=1 Tax=Aeromonas enteropelogenes TaxID=29489 RepID=UPI003BA04255